MLVYARCWRNKIARTFAVLIQVPEYIHWCALHQRRVSWIALVKSDFPRRLLPKLDPGNTAQCSSLFCDRGRPARLRCGRMIQINIRISVLGKHQYYPTVVPPVWLILVRCSVGIGSLQVDNIHMPRYSAERILPHSAIIKQVVCEFFCGHISGFSRPKSGELSRCFASASFCIRIRSTMCRQTSWNGAWYTWSTWRP